MSNQERKVKESLSYRSFEVFLPEYLTWSKRKDRRKQIMKPVFPGYLFVRTCFAGDRRIKVLRTGGVVEIIGTNKRPVAVPDREVDSIKILLRQGFDTAPHPIAKGQLVMVMEGPLAGVVGVVQRSTKSKIVVSTELVGRAVSATIDTESFSIFPVTSN